MDLLIGGSVIVFNVSFFIQALRIFFIDFAGKNGERV